MLAHKFVAVCVVEYTPQVTILILNDNLSMIVTVMTIIMLVLE